METYQHMKKEELLALRERLAAKYEEIKGLGLSLDMSRGKPGEEQLSGITAR